MDNEKNSVTVRINGSEYTLISEDSEEFIQRVAYYVDRRMAELSVMDRRLSTALVAVLTSVNIAEELFKSREDANKLREQLLGYAEDIGSIKIEADRLKLENEALQKDVQEKRIAIAKLETEIDQNKRNNKN